MKYWKGYKCVVAEDFSVQTEIKGYDIQDKFTHLHPNGELEIRQGYPWDLNSGPCLNLKSSIEASCVHDVLCDYINLALLPQSLQPLVDQEYYNIATKKGMWEWVARTRTLLVRGYMIGKGAKRYTRPVFEA